MEYKHGVYGEHIKYSGKLGSGGATIPAYIDTAPIWQLNSAGSSSFDYAKYIGVPVLIKGYTSAKSLLGFSEDLKDFGICEAVYEHFYIRGTGPVIAVNVADPSKTETAEQSETVTVTGKSGSKIGYLNDPLAAIENLTVTGVDDGKYKLGYEGDAVKITVTDPAFSTSGVTLTYHRVDVSSAAITTDVFAAAVDALDHCYQKTGRHPNLLVSPRFSSIPEYHALLTKKALDKLEGKWEAIVLSDLPATSAVNTKELALSWKSTNGYADKLDKVFWPMCKYGSMLFHASTVAAAVLEDQDEEDGDVPFRSLDNKDSGMDAVCLEDETEVLLNEEEDNELNAVGITTFNVIQAERRFWGCHMANYSFENEDNIDVEYRQDVYVRMNAYLDNYRKEHFADAIGRPMARRDIDAIIASMQQWLNSLVADGKMLYASVEFQAADNTDSAMASGDFIFTWAETYTPNVKSITHRDHYTDEGLTALTGGEDWMVYGNKTINYRLYNLSNGKREILQDTKTVKRPDIEYTSDTIKGPGLLGEIDMPTLAAVSSMSHEIGLRRETVDSANLMAPEIHSLELDWDTDVLNPTSGKIEVSHNKEIIKCLPKSFSPGSIEGNTSEDGTLKVEDLYYKRIQDGQALDEIDKLNGKLMINGVDYTSQINTL